MIIKRGNRLYGVVNSYIIEHGATNQKIKLTTPGISSETIYQGQNAEGVYTALSAELSKKNTGFIDLDAIVAKANPPAPEPEAETEADAEAPVEDAPEPA